MQHTISMLTAAVSLAGQVWPEGLCGVEFKVEGFSHKLPLLVASITHQLVHLQVLLCPVTLPLESSNISICGPQL